MISPHTTTTNPAPADNLTSRTGSVWPSALRTADAIKVVYVTGYGAGWNSVPAAIRSAIMLWTAHLYENREVIVTGTITSKIPVNVLTLLRPYKAAQL